MKNILGVCGALLGVVPVLPVGEAGEREGEGAGDGEESCRCLCWRRPSCLLGCG